MRTESQVPAEPTPAPPATRREADRLAFVPPRGAGSDGPWLHVVSGPGVPAVSRAVFELAARFLAQGQRVLLVDGAPRLRLHERFYRPPRPGLGECLRAGTPLLGLVQDTGRLGLYLLAHGDPGTHPAWPQLGRALEEARPYFGRIVIALDPESPEALQEPLAGQDLRAWWPQAQPAEGSGEAPAARLGIHFENLDLGEMLLPRLEAMEGRIWTLASGIGETPAAPVEPPAADPEPVPPVSDLDCDLRVRERLRFLIWTRDVEADAGRGASPGESKPGALTAS